MRGVSLVLTALAAAAASSGAAQVVGTAPLLASAGGAAPPAPAANPVPLPALPLPAGAKVMVFGDSHAAFNNAQHTAGGISTVGAVPTTDYGLLAQTWGVDPRFNFDVWYDRASPIAAAIRGSQGSAVDGYNVTGANAGVGGAHLDAALSRLAWALTRMPDIVWLSIGTNSVNSGDVAGTNKPMPAADVIARIDRMVDVIASRGIWVILPTLYPRGDWPAGDQRHQITRDVNAWIRAQAGRAGVRVYDPYDMLAAPDGADGVKTELFNDGVHLSPSGVAAVRNAYLLPLMQAMVAPGAMFDPDPAAANLWPAATYQLAGTTGSRVGGAGGTTGQVATGFTLRMTRGTSGTGPSQIAAKDAGSGGNGRQLVTITPTGIAEWAQSTLTFPALTTAQPEGRWLRAFVRVDAGSGPTAGGITLKMDGLNGAATVLTAIGNLPTRYRFATRDTGTYWIATAPFQVPPGGITQVNAQIVMNFDGAQYPGNAPFTVAIDRPILRIVPDPRPAWKL